MLREDWFLSIMNLIPLLWYFLNLIPVAPGIFYVWPHTTECILYIRWHYIRWKVIINLIKMYFHKIGIENHIYIYNLLYMFYMMSHATFEIASFNHWFPLSLMAKATQICWCNIACSAIWPLHEKCCQSCIVNYYYRSTGINFIFIIPTWKLQIFF